MKLNKIDFNALDKILSKIGFGSYYDLIQMLRDIAYNIEPKLQGKLEKETDLLKLIKLINKLTYILKKDGDNRCSSVRLKPDGIKLTGQSTDSKPSYHKGLLPEPVGIPIPKNKVENKKVIIWCGGEYTLKEGETINSVMIDYNNEVFDLELNFTKITDLEGNTLKEEKI